MTATTSAEASNVTAGTPVGLHQKHRTRAVLHEVLRLDVVVLIALLRVWRAQFEHFAVELHSPRSELRLLTSLRAVWADSLRLHFIFEVFCLDVFEDNRSQIGDQHFLDEGPLLAKDIIQTAEMSE